METRTHVSWRAMRERCENPNFRFYANYGGRGIKVCDRWLNYENFLADMGERPDGLTLDRIDNDGDYEPGNCRWATRSEQNLNRRPYKQVPLLRCRRDLHDLVDGNVGVKASGSRYCIACDRAYQAAYVRRS